MYEEDGVWYLSPNGTSTSHMPLEEAVRDRCHWVIETLIPSVRGKEQQDAISVEIERQAGRKTVVKWCSGCNHTTRHRLDTGCVNCSKEAGK